MDIEKYAKFLTDNRFSNFIKKVKNRTRYHTFIFENFYDSHNICAGLRSIEGFGFQDVHIIENNNEFDISKGVTQGSHKWLSIYKYKDLEKCRKKLKKNGYKIFVADPKPELPSINQMDFSTKSAFLFGQEGYGVSEEAKTIADGFFYIPIRGFVESFNVSVSVAITAYRIRYYLENNFKNKWKLNSDEKKIILESWLKKEKIVKKILEKEKK